MSETHLYIAVSGAQFPLQTAHLSLYRERVIWRESKGGIVKGIKKNQEGITFEEEWGRLTDVYEGATRKEANVI